MSSAFAGIKDNQYTKNLRVQDSDYEAVNQYTKIGNALNKSVKQYIQILRKLAQGTEGELSKSFDGFADVVALLLLDIPAEVLQKQKDHMKAYVAHIEHADSTLF